jgi:hypothetical protein
MNAKIIIAGLIAGIVSFFLGWLVWGILLMDYYSNSMVTYAGMEKEEPNLPVMALAQIASGLLLAFIIGNFSGKMNWQRGMNIGAIVGLLLTLSLDLFFYSMMNWYNDFTFVIVDVAINAVFTALLGAIVGWYMGRGAQKSS